MPFEKGHPGGPGRPPGSRNVIELLRQKIESERYAEQFADKLINHAMNKKDRRVSLQAIDSSLDRLYGKSKQAVDINVGLDENTAKRLAELAERLT